MYSDEHLNATDNLTLVSAVESALVAMSLTNGCIITMLGVRGRLNFEREIEKMLDALLLLGAELPSTLPDASAMSRPY